MKEVLITWLFQKRMANFENKKKKAAFEPQFPHLKKDYHHQGSKLLSYFWR